MQPSNIIVRMAALPDLDKIAQNNMAMAWETEKLVLSPPVITSGVRKILVGEQCCGGSVYYVAEVDGEVAGQLMVRWAGLVESPSTGVIISIHEPKGSCLTLKADLLVPSAYEVLRWTVNICPTPQSDPPARAFAPFMILSSSKGG